MSRLRWIVLSALLVAAVGALSACGSAADGADPADLEGVEWSLTGSSVSSADLGAAGITAAFDGERVAGFSGVNQYSGSYEAKTDGSIKIGTVASTLMAGPEPLMKAERAYLKLLEECDSFSVSDGVLTLSTGGNETLTFEKAKPASLPGTKWNVTGYNNGKQAVVGVSQDSTLTIEFGTDGTVSGSAGVNAYNGPFEAPDGTIKIGPLATTKMAGPEELMTQEAAFLAALENATKWSITRGMLEMRDESGAMQITATAQ